jgi:hypothetical protein
MRLVMSGSPPRRKLTRVLVGLGVGAGLAVTAFVATPAVGAVLDGGGQPPAERQPDYVSPYVPDDGGQPPAESQPNYVSPYEPDSVQPANPNPQEPGPATQLAPDEPASGAGVQPDLGDHNLPPKPPE